MRDDQSLWGMTLSDAVRADDVGSFCDSLWLTLDQNSWANGKATGLGGPEGPEPDKPSPRYRAASLSQQSQGSRGEPNKPPRSDK